MKLTCLSPAHASNISGVPGGSEMERKIHTNVNDTVYSCMYRRCLCV